MKSKYLIVVSIFLCLAVQAKSKSYGDESALKYLVKEVLLSGNAKGGIILLALPTTDIRDNTKPNGDVQYWSILQKYYPGVSKESLKKMVSEATPIKTGKIRGMPNVEILKSPRSKPLDYKAIEKKYQFLPICRISNLMYSKDGKTCIVFLDFYETSGFTVEIKQNASGRWISHVVTTDWMI